MKWNNACSKYELHWCLENRSVGLGRMDLCSLSVAYYIIEWNKWQNKVDPLNQLHLEMQTFWQISL